MSRDLLFELGVEEIPSAPLIAATAQLETLALRAFADARLSHEGVRVLSSPRRLALLVTGLAEGQEDLSQKVKGPSASAAFTPDGAPTKAAEGFARSRGVAVDDLVREDADGGSYVFALVEEAGRPSVDVLPGLLAGLAAALDWPKSMRWGSGTARFIRPVRWIVALFGEDVVGVEFAGLTSGRTSRGHRFLAAEVEIPSPSEYVERLRAAAVIVDHQERSMLVRDAIEREAAGLGAHAVVPPKTFAEVVNLVEWPTVAVGRFDDDFLQVPREVLEEAMESHQRYFPVEDADGKLMPRFIVVHNGDPERTAPIVAGHERVIRARLADAAFFYREDLAKPLESYVHSLQDIVFHEKLGSLGAKVTRIERLARALAEQVGVGPEDEAHAVRAAHLAKADLVTHVVVEFTSLQGHMGYHYALAADESLSVAEAIVDHYRPRFAGDQLPRSTAGCLVSIADKLDTVVGIFAIGQGPTGSADPYALRRSTIGILAMALDGGIRINLTESVAAALEGLVGTVPDLDVESVGATARAFVLGRLEGVLKDRGQAYDTVAAVLAVAGDDPADALARCEAVTAFRSRSDAMEDLSVAFTRAKNLADPALGTAADNSLMTPEEDALDTALELAEERSAAALLEARYADALEVLASLRGPIDAFFEAVLVMDTDERLRENRLRLLNRFVALFSRFADFSRISA
jgi:glycyl-tRNA synthetase beta chain